MSELIGDITRDDSYIVATAEHVGKTVWAGDNGRRWIENKLVAILEKEIEGRRYVVSRGDLPFELCKAAYVYVDPIKDEFREATADDVGKLVYLNRSYVARHAILLGVVKSLHGYEHAILQTDAKCGVFAEMLINCSVKVEK